MWSLKYDSAVPPLPRRVDTTGSDQNAAARAQKLLVEGCWLVWIRPRFEDELRLYSGWMLYYRGTLRVEHDGSGFLASGDLYVKQQAWNESNESRESPPPAPPEDIPIHPAREYRYYLRLTGLEWTKEKRRNLLQATFETFRFDASSMTWCPGGLLTAALGKRSKVPGEWRGAYLEGDLRNERGTLVGRLDLGWLDPCFRRARIELDRVNGVEFPGERDEALDFEDVFKEVKWRVTPYPLPEERVPSEGEVFRPSELHEAMLRWRDTGDHDWEWRYHLLIVKRFNAFDDLFRFGMMYDHGYLDSNLVPREGAVLAARAKFPNEQKYGRAQGKYLEEVPEAFFHAAIHELAHCMGLLHTYDSKGFQNALTLLADDPTVDFPGGLPFYFAPDDALRLKHLPDPWVRPGGPPAGFGFSMVPVPDSDLLCDERDRFRLEVRSLAATLPLGAPLRLQLRLENRWSTQLPGPPGLDFEEQTVTGRVRGPSVSCCHFFATAKRLNDSGSPRPIPPEGVLETSMTLMRGALGPLLPSPGRYTVEIEVIWRAPGGLVRVSAETSLLVTEPESSSHQEAAFRLLGCRELPVPLIFRTRPEELEMGHRRAALEEAIETLQHALGDPSLRSHFQAIEAIRLAERGGESLIAGFQAIGGEVVVTAREIAKLVSLAKEAAESDPDVLKQGPVKVGLKILMSKAQALVAAGLADPSAADRIDRLLGG